MQIQCTIVDGSAALFPSLKVRKQLIPNKVRQTGINIIKATMPKPGVRGPPGAQLLSAKMISRATA